MIKINEKLKKLRQAAGLRQGQIADFLGVTQTFISKAESGERNLTADQLEKLVNLYGYSLADFEKTGDHAEPIRFAFRAQDVNQEDLQAIAAIGRIAINGRFMAELLEDVHDR